MAFDPLAKRNFVRADWPGRRESPEQVAARLRRYLDDLISLDECLETWSVGRRKTAPYRWVRTDLAALVRDDVMRSESGEEEVNSGYQIAAMSDDTRQLFALQGNAGGIHPWPSWNRVFLYTNSGRTPVPEIVTYRLLKAVTLATIAAWEPLFCLVGSSDLRVRPGDGWYYRAWMTYVPPPHATSLDLLGVPFAERTPDGGLLLSATEDIFDAKNPAHVEGAQIISNAVRPLEAFLPSN